MMQRLLSILQTLFFCLVFSPLGFASNLAVVTRPMDFNASDSPLMRASPRGIIRIGDINNNHLHWKSLYGSLAITAVKSNMAFEGINDQGLSVYTVASTQADYGQRNHELPTLTAALWAQYLLDNFKTVQEALATLDRYQIISTPHQDKELPIKMALQDASGDSATIEFIDGKAVVTQGAEMGTLFPTALTRWISISDLTQKIYYFIGSDNPRMVSVDLKKLNLKQDSKIMMLNPTEIKLSGEISKQFK